MYYVAAGNTDARLISGIVTHRPGFTYGVKKAADSSFTAAARFMLPQNFPGIMYTFDGSLGLRSVWLTDVDRIILMERFLTRKTPVGQEEFLQDLRSKVRWWDGQTWQDRPVRIRRTSPAS